MDNQNIDTQMPFIIDDYQSVQNRILCELFTNKSKWFAHEEFGSNIYLIQGHKLTNEILQDFRNEIITVVEKYINNNEIISYNLITELASKRINWQLDIVEINKQTQTIQGII